MSIWVLKNGLARNGELYHLGMFHHHQPFAFLGEL